MEFLQKTNVILGNPQLSSSDCIDIIRNLYRHIEKTQPKQNYPYLLYVRHLLFHAELKFAATQKILKTLEQNFPKDITQENLSDLVVTTL